MRWDGLEVVGGVQLGTWATWLGAGGPVGHQGWTPPPSSCLPAGALEGVVVGLSACRPSASTQVQDPAIGRRPVPKTAPRQFCPFRRFLTFFRGERLRNGSEQYFLLRDLIPRQLRNQQMSWLGRQVAAASPETGSQLVKCQRTFRHWIATELLPAAE
jgi:hypothetical protein